jgi:hypothetical protein
MFAQVIDGNPRVQAERQNRASSSCDDGCHYQVDLSFATTLFVPLHTLAAPRTASDRSHRDRNQKPIRTKAGLHGGQQQMALCIDELISPPGTSVALNSGSAFVTMMKTSDTRPRYGSPSPFAARSLFRGLHSGCDPRGNNRHKKRATASDVSR